MAHSDTKKQAMRSASAERREYLKDAGLVQRSVWIKAEDSEKFDAATAALTDHARIISYLVGYDLGMTPAEIFSAIKKHGLPYDPDDMRILLSRGWLDDDDDDVTEAVLRKYNLSISLERLRR
jgi:hypothetical protein